MPGNGYLNQRSRPAQELTHRTLVNQGLRPQRRDAAPVDAGSAIAAAKRAYAGGPAAYAQPAQAKASSGTAGDGEVLS